MVNPNYFNLFCYNFILLLLDTCNRCANILYQKQKYEAYKRRNVAICIVVIITSLMTFGWLNAPSELESISADWEQTEFDVTETTEVSIRTTPSDAEIESLELSENDFAELDYTDGKAVITFKSPGKATLYFTAN